MTTLQVEFTESELLADHPIEAPLFANGVRCHGGFDHSGTYVSPRTANRWPAIHAWEAQRVEQFATPILDIPIDSWPENFPNIEQSKLLIRRGVPGPTISMLTRIGTVEGFGGMLRLMPIPDFQATFAEDISGTAIAHIGGGLFEAHARDEAGFEDEAGHNLMWFAARDLAFDNPVTEDQTGEMLARMGLRPGVRTEAEVATMRAAAIAARVLPTDIDFTLEMVVGRMIGLLFIEISAFHGFHWAEGVLSDTSLVASDGEAARIISYVRADETPHVAWLRTALSEMRDRTWVGSTGTNYDGTEMISLLWDKAIQDSMLLRRHEELQTWMREVERATEGRSDAQDLIEEMLSLGNIVRLADGTLVDTVSNPTIA
ncbi:MAG: hypothetical protein WCK41_01960 [Actinomycetes bacterium]